MYDVDYFIKKFEAIPENKWCTGTLAYADPNDPDVGIKYCSLGHCGVRANIHGMYMLTDEAAALIKLFGGIAEDDYGVVWWINDCNLYNPKANILNKLKEIKSNTQ